MNKKLTFGLIVVMALLQACKKKDNSKEQKEKPHPVKLLTRVWGSDYYNQTGTVQREALYTYDDQNRLVKKIEEGGQTSTYTYKDGKLSEVEYLFGKNTTVKSISKYIYENGRVKGATEILYSSPDVIRGTSFTNFIYVDNKVVKIETISGGKLTGVREYGYNGENIITQKSENGYVYTYTYDDKRNPYWNSDIKLAMRSVDNVSVNNPIEILTEPGYNIKIKDTYVYTYDDEGYPLTMQTPDGKSTVRNFEYTVR